MRSDTILGMDLSLTSSGLCGMAGESGDFCNCAITSAERGTARLLDIERKIADWTYENCALPEWIFLEGYSYNSRQGKQFDIGELGGVIKCYIRKNFESKGSTLVVVPPTTLKKITVGSGKAKKELMREWVFRKYGIGSEILKTNDEVDAYALCQLGYKWLYLRDGNTAGLTKEEIKTLEKI